MRLYLDDNITDRGVVAQLQRAGHTVSVPVEIGQAGATDAQHLAHAIRSASVLLTQDVKDFADVHDLVLVAGGRHPGLLFPYTEPDPARGMTPRSIAVAISKIEAAPVRLENHVYVINHWR